jgi:hypothetical protein
VDDLVQRLATGEHPVIVSLRPERTLQAFRESLDRGYVHVKFTATRGGTELGVPIDQTRSDFSGADLTEGTGRVKLVGDLVLDYISIRCVAEIDLPVLEGTGHLELLEASAP